MRLTCTVMALVLIACQVAASLCREPLARFLAASGPQEPAAHGCCHQPVPPVPAVPEAPEKRDTACCCVDGSHDLISEASAGGVVERELGRSAVPAGDLPKVAEKVLRRAPGQSPPRIAGTTPAALHAVLRL